MLRFLVSLLAADMILVVMTVKGRLLPCKAPSVPGVKYREISWCKVNGSVEVRLVMKNLHDNHTTLHRGGNYSYEVREDFSLLLPESALGECGTYKCILWPSQGQSAAVGECDYNPPDCIKPTEVLPTVTAPVTHSSGTHMARRHIRWPVLLALFLCAAGVIVCLYRRYKTSRVEAPD